MTDSRHESIDAARRRAGLSVQQLWLDYMSFSGIADLVEVEAYLHGLMPLPPYQEDKLALAVNERLDDLYRAARVPYSTASTADINAERPLDDIVDELLQEARRPPDEEE
jgi:hypothetical protein